MKYRLMSGTLYSDKNEPLATIHQEFCTQEKQISTADGKHTCHTSVLSDRNDFRGDVHHKKYICTDESGSALLSADPEYREHEDPSEAGWPVNRMPVVDHAVVNMFGTQYCLVMENSGRYILSAPGGKNVLSIIHRGLKGGWNLDSSLRISPEILCGIFSFCRYIEQENEFLIV